MYNDFFMIFYLTTKYTKIHEVFDVKYKTCINTIIYDYVIQGIKYVLN